MRVLHVIEAIEAGVARHVTDVVSRVRAEHHVLVPPVRTGGFTDLGAFEAMESAGARVHLTPMRRSVSDPHNVKAALVARRLIRSANLDIVHGHASIGGAVARIAAARTPAPCVYTPNGLLPGRGVIAAERLLGRLTNAFVAVSPSEAGLVRRLRIVPANLVTVVPNGIDLDLEAAPTLDLRAALGVGEETPVVGCVCRLAPQKAPEVFIRACGLIARSSDAHFVLIGDGPLREVITKELESVDFRERFLHVPGLQNASSVMSQFDVFALPSRYEAGPYAPLEAMRAGTPVVLTDVVGNRDTVVNGESGLLVAPDDPVALADAVTRVLGDRDLGARLASAARARLASHFDVRRMAAQIEALYGATAAAGR